MNESEVNNLLEGEIKNHPAEWLRLTSLHKKTFNFLFGQLMRSNPNLKINDSESGEGAVSILKRKLLEAA